MTGPVNAPMDAETTLAALDAVGVDFSVPRSDLLEWLNDPEFTEYPAFAAALLQLLGSRPLQRHVYIDVVVGFYEQLPGASTPHRVEDVSTDSLKSAILDGSNERYGEHVTDFESLLAPVQTSAPNMPEQRRAIREARRQREAAWRASYNAAARADDLFRRTHSIPADKAASVFGEPFVTAAGDAQNAKAFADNEAMEAQRHVEDVEATWNTDAAAGPIWADNGDLPLLLLPVRLETLYQPGKLGGAELWIRVYPDDIHIDGHETGLTAAERSAAEQYWSAVGVPGADETARAAAWAAVVATVGPARGLWAVQSLRPGGQGAENRDTTWTRAPLARLMPRHFTFSAYREGRLMWRVDGEPIPDELPAGFAPPEIDQDDEHDHPAGAVPWQRGSRWLVDFDEAVRVGMGVQVPLNDPDLHYDLLTVVGVGADNPEDSVRQVETLLAAHEYTNGVSILSAGTPTNNTPGSRSGWQSRLPHPSPDERTAAQNAVAGAGPTAAAQRLATALGIDTAGTLGAISGGLADPDDLAPAANKFLGALFTDLSADWLPVSGSFGKIAPPDLSFLTDHFCSFVRSRDPLPVLRVGRQPYGILPVTPTDLWRGEDVHEAITIVMSSVLSYLKENVSRAQRVGTGRDQDAVILDLLSRRPASTRMRFASELSSDFTQSFPAVPPATVGIASADTGMTFSMRGPIGSAPTGFDFSAAIDPTPELLTFTAGRPLQSYAEMIADTQAWIATIPDGGEINDWPPELAGKLKAVNDSCSQLDPATSGVFYQLALPLFHGMWWVSLLYAYPSRMPADHEMRPLAEGLARATATAVELEAIAVERLGDLERRLCEGLDTVTHRVDAWATSLATARLTQVRSEKPTGLRTGAYGWVTDLEPLSPDSRAQRDGYLVTPSMQHATTAAVLRAGCLAHSDPSAFAVNLTSGRVRTALHTLEGIKAGQSLDYLLGYRFERALHDRSMDHLIPAFRQTYPMAPQVDPSAENAGAAQAAVAARNVVDGLALSRDYSRFSLGDPPVPVGAELPTVTEIVADLVATFDAVGDLLLAESVHHIVGGNPLRAGLAADASSRGLLPDDFAVVSTPRSADTVSYTFGAILTDEFDAGTGWDADNGLAAVEPALENWCRARLGPADRWVFGCRRSDGTAVTAPLSALGAGALETVRTVDSGSQSTFARRLLAAAGAVEFTDDEGGAGRWDELVTLAASLRALIAAGTPLLATHFDPAADPWAAADLGEMAQRITAWSARVRRATEVLSSGQADPGGLRTAVTELIGCGLAVPADTDLADTDQLSRLAPDLAAVVAGAKVIESCPEPPSGAGRDSTSTLAWISAVTASLTALTGGGIPLLPRLSSVASGIDVLLDKQHRPTGAEGDELADWVRDIGRVRPTVRSADDALAATELIAGGATPNFVVTQAPAAPAPSWIATGRADARASTVLVVDREPAGSALTGIVFDMWSEVLPREGRERGTAEEVAGVAFHTARPDARAPQAILLAVPPDRARGWHIEDVHGAVEEALELAQVRGMDLGDLPELRAMMPPTFEGGIFTTGPLG
ncbi:hypothetical protein FK535_07255 [Mycolicibacterium sp. 018/SC-01/001]|uniref:hypothetical protein n=1 Tax=Mycolicibacterium sp. 018/SC-01/001 TaxID=2592069 RepID=UPI00117DC212|nr:hypothetical protein [Mycolicibacterium sp. 018/SC-01/001]TRW86253.1 hypothetical protein FK535_07255 [Mycolicibacterium sp. 018/SC-01/001]